MADPDLYEWPIQSHFRAVRWEADSAPDRLGLVIFDVEACPVGCNNRGTRDPPQGRIPI